MDKPIIVDSWGNPITHFTQWENNREIIIKGLKEFVAPPELHYWDGNHARAIVVPSEILPDMGGIKAKVPNILMQYDDDIVFTVYDVTEGNQGVAVALLNIPVLTAVKPEDYDYFENIDYVTFVNLIKEAEALLLQLNGAKDEIVVISEQALAAAKHAEELAQQFADELAGFLVADDSRTTKDNLWTAKKTADELGEKLDVLTVKSEGIPEIVSAETLRTYFYERRKATSRSWQFEISEGTNENIITALGGLPEDHTIGEKWFLYITLPYSEAGGFIIHAQLEGRHNGLMYNQDQFSTLNANWHSTGWIPTIQRGREVFTAVITPEVGRLVCDMTASQIIDASRQGVVKAEYEDEASGETREYYYFKQMPDGRAVFTKDGYIENGVPKQTLFYVDFAGMVEVETREPTADTAYAVCNAEAAPSSTVPVKWFVPKDMPKPSGNVGMMLDVFWKNGRADGIGYDISLIWGEEGGSENEEIVPVAPTTDSLTGEYSIPAEGTVQYQLIEQSGRKRWRYVSGKLISKQFSSDTAADAADKAVHGMEINYLPGMEVFLKLDKGNTAEVMRIVPESGETLPVYGNGMGAKTGNISAGYILHMKNAGDHWQILNSGEAGGSGGGPAITHVDVLPEATKEEYDKGKLYLEKGKLKYLVNTLHGVLYATLTSIGGSLLPDGYQELEYIEGNGPQFIGTAIKMDFSVETYCKIEMAVTKIPGDLNRVFGGSNVSVPFMVFQATTGGLALIINSPSSSEQHIQLAQNHENEKGFVVISSTDNGLKINLEFGSDKVEKNIVGGRDNYGNLKLFRWDDRLTRENKSRIYSVEHSFEGKKTRLIPCYRLKDDVTGMYDVEHNVFVTNSGSGDFIRGPEVIS